LQIQNMLAMNSNRRSLWTPSSRTGFATPKSHSSMPSERADLQGLEVSDSSWDEWVLVQQEVQERRAAVAQSAPRKTSLQ
jgi:hypothetical protein